MEEKRSIQLKESKVMKKMQKFVEQIDWSWYVADITKEQATEYESYLDGIEKGEDVEEPEWLHELDYKMVKDKQPGDTEEFEIIED